MPFSKATKTKSKLRLAISGPGGSGKTYTSLALATVLAQGERFAVIDSERGSASKFAGIFDFDVDDEWPRGFPPEAYIAKLRAAADAKYPVVIIDSMSHEWEGDGGCFEIIDQLKSANPRGNDFTVWRTVTPRHKAFVEAILTFPGHVIGTLRSKTEYVLEANDQGKMVPRKVGLAPIQRNGFDYEFDVFASMDLDNTLRVEKTRCEALREPSSVWPKPGKGMADVLLAWLTDGVEPPTIETPSDQQVAEFNELIASKHFDAETVESWLRASGHVTWLNVPIDKFNKCVSAVRAMPEPAGA